MLKSFQWFNIAMGFFKLLSTEFAASLKPPSRDNHRKASYPSTQKQLTPTHTEMQNALTVPLFSNPCCLANRSAWA